MLMAVRGFMTAAVFVVPIGFVGGFAYNSYVKAREVRVSRPVLPGRFPSAGVDASEALCSMPKLYLVVCFPRFLAV